MDLFYAVCSSSCSQYGFWSVGSVPFCETFWFEPPAIFGTALETMKNMGPTGAGRRIRLATALKSGCFSLL